MMLAPFPHADAVVDSARRIAWAWANWLNALRTQTNTHESQVAALQAQVTALEARVAALEGP